MLPPPCSKQDGLKIAGSFLKTSFYSLKHLKMVTVSNYALRNASDGHQFITLELNGGLEFIQSQNTGKFYATTRKCSIPCTFGEEVAKTMIGSSFPGEVVRVESDPYEYTIKDTGEVITLNYSYQYLPETTSKQESRSFQTVEA
jgi:hypothetical protein